MNYSDFSSWPRDQEQSFVVYEQHASDSTKKALTMGVIAGIIFFVFMVGIYAGVAPDKKDLSQGMNMSNLTKKSRVAPAPAATPDPPKAEAPAPAGDKAAAPADDKAAAPADDKK